jgi:hypothetical protein
MYCILEKIDQWQVSKDETRLSEQFLELVSVLKEAGRNFTYLFFL